MQWKVTSGQMICAFCLVYCRFKKMRFCIEALCSHLAAGGIQALSERPTGFLQCFDTVGLVVRLVKIVPEMIYNVLSATLSLYTTTTLYRSVVFVHRECTMLLLCSTKSFLHTRRCCN